MDPKRLRDVYYGCILGGACGDAMGYPVEFMRWKTIRQEFGSDGIGYLKLHGGRAYISDDTQMTLFTMAGMISGMARMDDRGIGGPMAYYINMAYCDWLHTQEKTEGYSPFTQIYNLPPLHETRAPGNTCLSALEEQLIGSENPPYTNRFADPEHPANDRKGCGGVMRVAPVGLMVNEGKAKMFYGGTAARLGAEAAAITHGHPLGWLSAALLAEIVSQITWHNRDEALDVLICRSMREVAMQFSHVPETEELIALCEKAIGLAKGRRQNDAAAIRTLGEGWVAEEALAIAIYAAVKYSGNFYAAMCTAVNHDGDSDSTGAIAGNILGAYMGFAKMQRQLYENDVDVMRIELAGEMMQLCDELLFWAYGEDKTRRERAQIPLDDNGLFFS